MQKQISGSIKEILSSLKEGVQDVFESTAFKQYLNVLSNFHSYSENNVRLIYKQCPHATLVAGYRKWENVYGRHVNAGEKAIKIIAPRTCIVKQRNLKRDKTTGELTRDIDGNILLEDIVVPKTYYRIVNVFDISQTSGKPLPILHPATLSDRVPDYERLIAAFSAIPECNVKYKNLPEGTNGMCSQDDIVIKKCMSESQTIKTLVHEIAHFDMHRELMNDSSYERELGEIEAESVAYTVCRHFNIDTSDYSFIYIAGWSQSHSIAELEHSLGVIHKTAANIIAGVEEYLQKTHDAECGETV